MNQRPSVTATVTTLVLAGLLAACSSDDDGADAGGTTTTTATTTTVADPDLSGEAEAMFETESEFAQCMRDNGVDGFPDPQVNENGFIVVGIPFAARGDVEMDAARQVCQRVFDNAGPPDTTGAATTIADPNLAGESEAMLETESEFAQCMRDNGVDGFPGPQVNENGFIVVGIPFAARRDVEMDAARQACQRVFDDAAPPEETSAAAAGWEQVVPGGDCECADGSEFAFWERRADPTRVVFFLDGGGTCSDATTSRSLATAPPASRRTTGTSGAKTPHRRAGSSTSPGPTTRSSTTASSTCRLAPVTCTWATSPGSTRRT